MILFTMQATQQIRLQLMQNWRIMGMIMIGNIVYNNSCDYKFIVNDHVAYRYEMLETLGHGSFGYVYKVMDHKYHQLVALKIIKNKEKFHN